MPRFPSAWLGLAAKAMNDKQTNDSVEPTSSPIDLLAGSAGSGLAQGLLAGGEAKPLASAWPNLMEQINANLAKGAAHDATIPGILAERDPMMLARWNNRLKYPLSPEEDDWVDLLVDTHKRKK